MDNEHPEDSEATAKSRLEHLVAAWNQASFEDYSRHFAQHLLDHFNQNYFERLRNESGKWESSEYLGCLKQSPHRVYLWRARFERSANEALFSMTMDVNGQIVGLLKRFSRV